MNDKNNSKINWLNIIFNKEFQNYLNLDILKEISLVSKLVRIKLNPKLFYAIKIEEDNKYIKGLLENYYINDELSEEARPLSPNVEELHKGLYIDRLISNIKSELENIKRFVSSIYFKRLNHIAYYLFPLLESFDNLTTLKLYDCTFPYSTFVNLGVSFFKLRCVELYGVTLVKLPGDTAHLDSFNIPPDLRYLTISIVEVNEPGALFNPYDMLFNELDSTNNYRFALPKVEVPSLKKLNFIGDYDEENDLEDFLDINSKLESLAIGNLYLDKAYNFKSLKNLEVGYVDCFDNEINFTTQEGIKELTVVIDYEDDYENVAKLCKLCPNLEKLYFRILNSVSIQNTFYNFLIPVLSKLPNVKTLRLKLHTNESDILNINKFPHIENIIFEIDEPYILNIKFHKCKSLKTMEVKSDWFELYDDEFLDELSDLHKKYKN
ncbi:hypothetical protein CONCODRAFT_20839, partial [Conidiobolus coronatus NRRL 28638]